MQPSERLVSRREIGTKLKSVMIVPESFVVTALLGEHFGQIEMSVRVAAKFQ